MANVMNITLAGALDDVHGRRVRVWQDHDGVRIDAGGIEIMLDQSMAGLLSQVIFDARVDADIWAASQGIADD